jgi:TRAP-type uncharacterized transport system substrate-binding protein
VALAVGFAFAITEEPGPARHITLTAGYQGTTRAVVAHALASEVSALGSEAEVVDAEEGGDELDHVNSGAVDFALVSGALRIEGYSHVREVAPLYVEALHLLVKRELAEPVGTSLTALRGRTVDLGGPGTTSAGLATAVLAFADVRPGGATADGYVALGLRDRELAALLERGDRSALPDAVFHLATVPSLIALRLVRSADYRLVPLPFAEAFRLTALIGEGPTQGPAARIERPYTMDTVVPAFSYQIEAPVPAGDLHTVGTRLLLVAHEGVSAETVGRVLDAVFASRFARMHRELLDPSMLGLAPRLAMHPGTRLFLAHDKPFLTAHGVEDLSNTMSVFGTLAGGGLFLWQGLRQRRQGRRDQLLAELMLRVAECERRIVELELSSNMELEALITLQRDLLQLKSEVLERFTNGELGGQMLSELLVPVNAARDHVGELLLHVRENLEKQAETQGRPAEALWVEAAAKSDETT